MENCDAGFVFLLFQAGGETLTIHVDADAIIEKSNKFFDIEVCDIGFIVF